MIPHANLLERHFFYPPVAVHLELNRSIVQEEVDSEMSGRSAAVFRPKIVNQLRVVEIAPHFLRQSRLSNGNKECPCSISDCIARPERELAFAVSLGMRIGDRRGWHTELHHAGGYSVIATQQARMSR